MVKNIRSLSQACFALGEHSCAIGYAMSELAFSQAHVVLYYSSGFLLVAWIAFVSVKFINRKG